MVTILMIPGKLAALGLLKIKIFRNKGCDAIITEYDFTNQILSHESSYTRNVVMWQKFDNSMREVIIT